MSATLYVTIGKLSGKVKDGVIHIENHPTSANTSVFRAQVMLQSNPSQAIESGTIDVEVFVGAKCLEKISYNARDIQITAGQLSHLVIAEIYPAIDLTQHFGSIHESS